MESSPLIASPERHAPKHPRYDAIHRALLTGLLSSVAAKTETYEYLGPRNIRMSIFPGSALFGQKQKWIVAAELVETSKLYARTCAAIQPQWIERAADHLVERSYSDPRWDCKSATVVATEKVILHGLVLIPARTVPFGPINPRLSRELFIHHALVLGDLPIKAPFARHNAALIEQVELLEAKIRQRNLLADAATRYAFYDTRIPQDIHTGAAFESWRRRAERAGAGNPRLLFMSKADLLRADAPAITPENYPDRLADRTGNLKLPLIYRYQPGEITDGLTLTIPVAALAQLRPERYEWLVPGMLEEKISALLRELPGHLRRNFVPVPTWAQSAAQALAPTEHKSPDLPPSTWPPSDLSLREALAHYLANQTGVEIHAADFTESALPPYLRMNFKVLDDTGNVLALSRDLAQAQRKLAPHTAAGLAALHDRRFHRDHIVAWDFGDLPDSVTLQRFGMTITAFPALIESWHGHPAHDAGAASGRSAATSEPDCSLRLLPSRELADSAHRAGVRRLFRLQHRREIKPLAKHLPHFGQMALQHFTLGESRQLKEDLLTLILDRALFLEDPPPHKKADYESLTQKALTRLEPTASAVSELTSNILDQYHQLTLTMDRASVAQGPALSDVREQLAYLMPKTEGAAASAQEAGGHFLLTTSWQWLQHVPRYLAGMRLRLEKLENGGPSVADRDLDHIAQIAPFWNQYLERKQHHDAQGIFDPELTLFRWMLEEYRLHLFAQELGTLMPTSPRRLEKQWEKTRSTL